MAALCVALIVTAIGCGGPSVELVVPNPDNRADSAIPSTKGLPYSFGDYMLCISADGSIEITDVVAEGEVGQLQISAFAIRPALKGGTMLGTVQAPLSSSGFEVAGPVTVNTTCPEDFDAETGVVERLTEFAFQVERQSDETASFESLTVRYTSGDDRGELKLNYGLTLCAADDAETQACAGL